MKLTITIESDNVGVGTDHAVAAIVHAIANKIASGHESGKARDSNGNTVGSWEYERATEEEEPEGDYMYDTVEECKASGDHLSKVDNDGYCTHCGNQYDEDEPEECEEENEIVHPESCPACGGDRIEHMGALGTRQQYKCKSCGTIFSPNDY